MYKGGPLCALHKGKGSMQEAAQYRGIILSNSLGKAFHSLLRSKLLPTYLQRKTPGQLGGLPSRQTSTAIHLLRLHARVGRIKKVSTGVMFVDLLQLFITCCDNGFSTNATTCLQKNFGTCYLLITLMPMPSSNA